MSRLNGGPSPLSNPLFRSVITNTTFVPTSAPGHCEEPKAPKQSRRLERLSYSSPPLRRCEGVSPKQSTQRGYLYKSDGSRLTILEWWRLGYLRSSLPFLEKRMSRF